MSAVAVDVPAECEQLTGSSERRVNQRQTAETQPKQNQVSTNFHIANERIKERSTGLLSDQGREFSAPQSIRQRW